MDNLERVSTRLEYVPPASGSAANLPYWDVTDPEAPWFSYAGIVDILDPAIEVADQIEVSRIFDESNKSETLNLTVADRRAMFIIPKTHITVDTTLERITLNLTEGEREYQPETDGSDPIPIPAFVRGNDTVIIKRRTFAVDPLVTFATGRLTPKSLNFQVRQLQSIIQEILDDLHLDYIRQDDQYATTGPFLGNSELNMGGYQIVGLEDPGQLTDATNKNYVLDRHMESGVMAADDDAPTATQNYWNDTSPDYSPAPLWFDPKTGSFKVKLNNTWVRLHGVSVPATTTTVTGKLDASGDFDPAAASYEAFNTDNEALEGTWAITIIAPTTAACTFQAGITSSNAFTGVANAAFTAVRTG